MLRVYYVDSVVATEVRERWKKKTEGGGGKTLAAVALSQSAGC